MEALPVAILGLAVNLVSAKILLGAAHAHAHSHDGEHGHHHHDHNLRAAYMHVVADALTSVLAIVALLGIKFLGLKWLDPTVAIVGAVVIIRWAMKLVWETTRQLIDLDPSTKSRDAVRAALERLEDTRVSDLHLWRVGPGKLVCVVAVSTHKPLGLEAYKKAVYEAVPVEHLTVEIRAL